MTPRLPRLFKRGEQRKRPAGALPLGFHDTERRRWVSLPMTHTYICGLTGSGKSQIITNLLVNMADAIAEGKVLTYGVDLKDGVEMSAYGRLIGRLATEKTAASDMFSDLRNELAKRNRMLIEQHRRKVGIGQETPLLLVILDEAAELRGDSEAATRKLLAPLDSLLRLGRSAGLMVIASSQDPRKESFKLRDRFPSRIALRLNSIEESRLLMGEDALQAGCAPWLIPLDRPGTGWIWDTRMATRFRVPFIDDTQLEQYRT
ncbi:type IV secretory system conjugative DNA transfer family protein [Bifidobacterium primatium]|nr:FtsK/SpoIIIE domain-containing protein [Bifidobacterium primatium]